LTWRTSRHALTTHYTLPLFYPYLPGALLGVLQMGVWLVWDPWWSLALGGAAVGFLTDWFALKVDAFFQSNFPLLFFLLFSSSFSSHYPPLLPPFPPLFTYLLLIHRLHFFSTSLYVQIMFEPVEPKMIGPFKIQVCVCPPVSCSPRHSFLSLLHTLLLHTLLFILHLSTLLFLHSYE
jgi:hypothetical protein